MRHNQYNIDFHFIKNPIEFTKYSEKDLLAYCLGATLYMPALKNFSEIIINNIYPGLTSIVVCFEDAINESDIFKAEDIAIDNLKKLNEAIISNRVRWNEMPLVFFRVRSIEQFINFTAKLAFVNTRLFAGFVFPKFSSENGEAYYNHLKKINMTFQDVLYGMPVLESKQLAYKESRLAELLEIKDIVDKYKDLTLNIRVGATDISSAFAVRRGVDYSIYDILPVKDCILDILNVFIRENAYIVSGPVWEFFLISKENKFDNSLSFSLQSSLLRRKRLVNEAIDGLLREVILDKANGFIGKTVIHPTHIKYVNAMQAVTEEEYNDAVQILHTSGGVIKSPNENKMNEINPHMTWARKIYNKALVYGVIKDETEYIKLISNGDFE